MHIDLVPKRQYQMTPFSRAFILHLCKVNYPHAPAQARIWRLLLPKADKPLIPLLPVSASPAPSCHVFDHGSEWSMVSPRSLTPQLLPGPLPLQSLDTAVSTCLAHLEYHLKQNRCLAWVCAPTSKRVPTHVHAPCCTSSPYLCVHLWHYSWSYIKYIAFFWGADLSNPSPRDDCLVNS